MSTVVMNQMIVKGDWHGSLSSQNPPDHKDGLKISTTLIVLDVKELPPPVEFLTLPREIRDCIYSLVFRSKQPLYPSKERAGISEYLGLLRTNHQVYAEVVETLYARNTFQVRGTPAWKAPELLNLLSTQRRDGYVRNTLRSTQSVCIARFALRKLYIPSHNIGLKSLQHLFSLLKYFPNLEYLRVVFVGFVGLKDMDVVDVCRLFMDRRPLFKKLVLCKRATFDTAEDISWIVHETPSRTWTAMPNGNGTKNMWISQDGVMRKAEVVAAPQCFQD